MTPVAIAALTLQYREHPGWTAQLHLDNLRVACQAGDSPVASYATVRRYLRAQGMHRQARPLRATAGAIAARDRLAQLEVRSFEVEHVATLWHLDFHHASRRVLTRAGTWRRSLPSGLSPAVVSRRDGTASGLRAEPGIHEARPCSARRSPPDWPRWVSCTRRHCLTARTPGRHVFPAWNHLRHYGALTYGAMASGSVPIYRERPSFQDLSLLLIFFGRLLGPALVPASTVSVLSTESVVAAPFMRRIL